MGIGIGIDIGITNTYTPPQLSPQQKNEILKIGSSLPGFSCQGAVGSFLDNWLACEILAKKLIVYHKKLNDMPSYWSYEQVSAATKYFCFQIDPILNKAIFKGGHGKRGSLTPRQLRNAYLHSMSAPDIDEIESRISELTSMLSGWRNKIIEI